MAKWSGLKMHFKLTMDDIGGAVAKADGRYIVKDNTTLNNLVVSSTRLYPGQETSGHNHDGQEEVYIFVTGSGIMSLRYPEAHTYGAGGIFDDGATEYTFKVNKGDVILIEDGVFHKVSNPTGDHALSVCDDLYFICVFDGKREH